MTKLKPCPFCGSDAKIIDNRTIFTVQCTNCFSVVLGERAPEPEDEEHCESIDWNYYEKTAIDRWNTRPPKQDCASEMYGMLNNIINEAKDYENRTGNVVTWVDNASKVLAKARGEA